jgi:ribosomal protein S18 acetylase RimI-like enzyme
MSEIRPITDADIDAVAAVRVRSWQVAYAGIVPADYLAAMDPVQDAERRRSWPVPPGAQTLVAVAGGQVIGFVSFGPSPDDEPGPAGGHLYAIYVDPASWGHGAGRRLIEGARRGLAAAGCTVMRLWVLEENHRARRFYERAGLAPDGTRNFYTPRGTTAELPELRYAVGL